MARPLKEGLDYFPLDVDVDQDDKVAIIEGMHGVVGFGIVIKLLMHIYKNSYYYRWTEKQQILFARRVNVNIDEVNAVVNDCVKWGMFDEDLFNAYQILTSRGVQKRYFEITKRRQQVEVIEEYLLIEDSDINTYTNLVYVNIKPLRADKCIHDADNNLQSKVKESKGKESKGKDGTVAADSIHKEVVEYLNEKTGKSYSHTSKATQQMIRARQKDGFSLEDFKYVIDIKSAQWKDDPKMDKFLRPSTLFRPSNFESYLQEKHNLKKVRAGDFELSSETEKQIDEFQKDQRLMQNMTFEQKTQYLLGKKKDAEQWKGDTNV